MRKSASGFTRPSATTAGFTIVELLIVIVVIAILAAITIVAYNGIRDRANNTQTTDALRAWIKAMKLYKVDNGKWPNVGGYPCLGTGYKYGVSGTDTSGVGQCRQDSSTSGFTENTAFNDLLKPYLSGTLPTPAMVTASNNATTWRRGLAYYFTGGDGTVTYITAAYAGALSECPTIDGISSSPSVFSNGNTLCQYIIGHTYDT